MSVRLEAALADAQHADGVATSELCSDLGAAELTLAGLHSALRDSEARRHGLAFRHAALAARKHLDGTRARAALAAESRRASAAERAAAARGREAAVVREALWAELHEEEMQHAEAEEQAKRKAALAEAALTAAESRARADALKWNEERRMMLEAHGYELDETKRVAKQAWPSRFEVEASASTFAPCFPLWMNGSGTRSGGLC